MRSIVPLLTLVALGTSAMSVAAPATPAGSVSGTITYTGTPPKMKPIDMAKEPSCASQHATPAMTEGVVSGAGNTLGYVVVYVSAGDQPAAAPSTPVRYDQKGCQYIPHVAVMQPGQPLEIYNNDQTSHNIHPLAKVNAEWNKSQPPGTPPLHASFEKPEFIAVKCNVHPWMKSYIAVLSNPYFQVTGADGMFSLKNVPPGTYTLVAWHESLGPMEQSVTIAASETKGDIHITYKPKASGAD